MELRREFRIVNGNPKYDPPLLKDPPATGYLHIAASVAPPTGPPIVRNHTGRAALLAELRHLADDLRAVPGVTKVTVYRAVLIPPAGRNVTHPARFDVAVLIETGSPEMIDQVQSSMPYENVLTAVRSAARDVHVMPARCLRFLGDVDKSREGLFLFNYFAGPDRELATQLWEHLAGWYVAETGLDNSTLLAPTNGAGYVLVNHARWDKSPLQLAFEQFTKPSFFRYVRGNLKANGVTAMPALYRLG